MPSKVVVRDKVWRQLKRKIGLVAKSHVKVGIVGPSASSTVEEGFSLVELAAVHEFGSPKNGIPERSFIRRTFRIRRKRLAAFKTKLSRAIINDRISVDQALKLLGEFGATEVKNTITQGRPIPPKLKPQTVRRKGSDRPLVDTGRLLNSITYEVKKV